MLEGSTWPSDDDDDDSDCISNIEGGWRMWRPMSMMDRFKRCKSYVLV